VCIVRYVALFVYVDYAIMCLLQYKFALISGAKLQYFELENCTINLNDLVHTQQLPFGTCTCVLRCSVGAGL